MAITVDNWSTGNTTGSLTFNPNTALGTLSVGDVLFLIVETANETVSLSPSGGFIEIGQQGTGSSGGSESTRLSLFYQQVTSLPISTSCTITDAGNHMIVGLMVVHGCVNDGGQPFVDPVWRVNTPASTTATWDAATNPNNNSAVLLCGCDGVDFSSIESMQTVTNSVVGDIVTANSSSPSSTGFSWTNTAGNGGQIVAAFAQLPTSPGSTGTSTAPHSNLVSVTATIVLLSERIVNVDAGADPLSAGDAASVAASQSVADATDGDDPKPSISVSDSESASVTESATVATLGADGLVGGESAGVTYEAQVGDIASGTDTAQASSTLGSAESGSAVESAVVTVRASESSTVGDVVVPMDVGTDAEDVVTASDSGSVFFPSSDVAQVVESSAVLPDSTDAAASTESALVSVTQYAGDLATASDTASVIVHATTDLASGVEGAYIFIEGVGVVGSRVVRVASEDRGTAVPPTQRRIVPASAEQRVEALASESRTVRPTRSARTRTVPQTDV